MARFVGKYPFRLDSKSRMSIPAPFRDELVRGGDLEVVTLKGLDGCLFSYPLSAFQEFESRFKSARFDSEERGRLLQRVLAFDASIQRHDSQGRITLTEDQKRYAGLQDQVMICGNFGRMEIWEPSRLAAYLKRSEEEGHRLEDLAPFFSQSAPDVPKEGNGR